MNPREINIKYQPGKTINLQGYTSTTMDIKRALIFANSTPDDDKIPVLLEIIINDA